MKGALLLPGYLDSPDYLHFMVFEKRLKKLGYVVERLDPADLWRNKGKEEDYTISNYLELVKKRVEFLAKKNSREIVLIGHSLGAFVSIIAGNRLGKVNKIVALCPPAFDRKSLFLWGRNKDFRYSKREEPDNKLKFREFYVPKTLVDDIKKFSVVDEVKNIDKDLMIFIALEDKSVPPRMTEKIVTAAKNPYVIRQKEMGHNFRYSERESNLVAGEIEKFLAK